MAIEKTSGAVVYRVQDGQLEYLLLQSTNRGNFWGFPKGHVEGAEDLITTATREIKEETGLTLHSVTLCGVKQFYMADKQTRYLVFLYRSNDFSGELQSSNEGEVYWLDRDELERQTLAHGFDTMIPIFENPNLSENFHQKIDGKWQVENK